MIRGCLPVAVLLGVIVIAVHPLPASAEEPRVRVTYNAPRISVEASGVTVAAVLRKIGEAVGFAVVGDGASNRLRDFSLRDVPLTEALQRLLRAHDHVVVYGDDAQTVDKVVLLGDRVAIARSASGQPDSLPRRAPDDRDEANPFARIAPIPGVPAPSATIATDIEEFRRMAEASPEVASATDLLFRHAWSGSPASATTPMATPAAHADPGSALVVTTVLARHNLSVLINALSAATTSMLSANRR